MVTEAMKMSKYTISGLFGGWKTERAAMKVLKDADLDHIIAVCSGILGENADYYREEMFPRHYENARGYGRTYPHTKNRKAGLAFYLLSVTSGEREINGLLCGSRESGESAVVRALNA